MARTDRAKHDPHWLWPAVVMLAVLAGVCGLLARPVAFLCLPLIGVLGWWLHGLGFRLAASWAIPLGIVLAALTILPVPSWVLAVASLAAAAGTAWMLVDRGVQLSWLSVLPASWRGEPWGLRVELAAFTDASQHGNELFRRVNNEGPSRGARRDLAALAADARRQRDRSGVWRGAWDAFIAQLDTVAEFIDSEDPASCADALDERRLAVREAIMSAAEETRRRDPFGVWIEQPGVGMIEDTQGRPVRDPSSRAGG